MRIHFGHAITFIFIVILSSCKTEMPKNQPKVQPDFAIVIHGGAGTITREGFSAEREAKYTKALDKALEIGENILKSGGSSLDAVEAAIISMENDPLFNSGKGAVFTFNGENELDASIMEGDKHESGAVSGVKVLKNPISAARAVMEQSPHVMLFGVGAEEFAIDKGIDTVSPRYFYTKQNWDRLQRVQEESKATGNILTDIPDYKYGTVGCVALDKSGNIAAGTSTGGMTNKRWNRIGDSPVIGAGTYADNATCGVSSTGHGEYFIRFAVAHDISRRMAYLNESVEEAANYVVMDKLVEKGGAGGVIALDRYGNVAAPFNTTGMFRAYANPEKRWIKMFKE